MTPKERAVAALELRQPDMVPTFELEFQLEEEMFGVKFLRSNELIGRSPKEKDAMLKKNAENIVKVYSKLEYSIIPIHYLEEPELLQTVRLVRKIVGDEYMITVHGDGTMAIPSGSEMLDFVYRLADQPEEVKAECKARAENAIERNKRAIDGGVDVFILCDDYCFNSGSFLSPAQFEEFIQPYLYNIIDATKRAGAYCIKHTDGNIMPILDQLVQCKPNALHSIDPMAGVDIKEVKRLVGDKVCLCGNVHCASLQTGTDEDVIESARYCLTHAKPGGGYIFCTSNIPFKGMKPERYQMVLDVWKSMREYK